MRYCFLIVMIALLPLRAWIGDSMAGQMSAQQMASLQAQAGSHHAMPDCPGHATQAGEDGAPLDASGMSCASCQVCCAPALQSVTGICLANAPAQARPFGGVESFASAAAQSGLKPPIS